MSLLPLGKQEFLDSNGAPYAGAHLYIFQSGTNNPVSVFADAYGARSINKSTYPIVLDASGKCTAWVPSNLMYRLRLKNSLDSLVLFEEDNVGADNHSSTTSAGSSANKTLFYTAANVLYQVDVFTDATKTVLLRRRILVYTGNLLTTVQEFDANLVLKSTKTLAYTLGLLTGVTQS
jgi:hypothetical protein